MNKMMLAFLPLVLVMGCRTVLLPFLLLNAQLRLPCLRALWNITQQHWFLLGHSDAQVRTAAAQIIKSLGDPDALPQILAIAQSRADVTVRIAALDALAGYRDPQVEALMQEYLSSADVGIRQAVYRWIAAQVPPSLQDALLSAADTEMNLPSDGGRDYVRRPAIQALCVALGSYDQEATTLKLIEILKTGEKGDAMNAAIEGLRRIRNPKAMDLVLDYLETDDQAFPPDSNIYPLFEILRRGKSPRNGEVLIKLLDHTDRNIRMNALSSLSQASIAPVIPRLLKMLETGKTPAGNLLDDNERMQLLNAVNRTNDPRAGKVLLSLVQSASPSLAQSAAYGLMRCVDPTLAGKLVEVWRETPEGPLKNTLQQALNNGRYGVLWNNENKDFDVRKPAVGKDSSSTD